MIDSKIFLFIRKYRNRADIQILHSQQKKKIPSKFSVFHEKRRKSGKRERRVLLHRNILYILFLPPRYRSARKNTRSPAFASTILFAFYPGTHRSDRTGGSPVETVPLFIILYTNTKPYALGTTSKPCRSLVFTLDTVERK